MKNYHVIGIMSGTSLDGLDIAYCVFQKKEHWKYKIAKANTINYSHIWKNKLINASSLNKKGLSLLSKEFGTYIGQEVNKFIKQNNVAVDFVASHGHTIFHDPAKGLTLQIGDGQSIAKKTKLPVVCDFRIGDVALGGQGAPLVPIADKLLFAHYKYCLNLGGFANISYDKKRVRLAFDICPVNIVLNQLAKKVGKEFDNGGRLAAKGKVNNLLLAKLNNLAYYRTKGPKSLGREWVEKKFNPVLNSFPVSTQDKLRTVVEHAAIQIGFAVSSKAGKSKKTLLITGGGVYNKFLITRIKVHAKCNIKLPDDKTIQFKEAMAFAFIGLLKISGEVNILKSVTGAKKNSSGGVRFFPT